jgi:glucosamine 6-phosphate synthetase-like amidotransferase/phosphosugar isomerase protein
MCGIAGFYRFSKKGKGFSSEQLADCIISTHSRGGDAVGIYSPSIGIVKEPQTAIKFCSDHEKELAIAVKDRFCIIHNRKAASGRFFAPAKDNENNHPHESKDWILIHNGILHDSPIIKDYKYNSKCDSEIAVSYLQEFGLDGLEMLCDDDGFALAFVHKPTGDLYLIRHHNPIVYGYERVSDSLVFGSTTEITDPLAWEETNHNIKSLSVGTWWNMAENKLCKVTVDNGLEVVKDNLVFVRTKHVYETKAKRDPRFERLEPIQETKVYGSEYGVYGDGQQSFFNRGGRGGGQQYPVQQRSNPAYGIDLADLHFQLTSQGIQYAIN